VKTDIDSLLSQFKSALLEIDDTASGTAYNWYQTIKNRSSDREHLDLFGFNDDEEKMLWVISAHFDEYRDRMIDFPKKEKEIFIKMRVISFGAIYSSLLHLKRQISEISNIPAYNSAYDTDLDYEIFHAKASLYSAAKFAVELADVKISDLEKWYPDYIHDKKLIKGDDQLDMVGRILDAKESSIADSDKSIESFVQDSVTSALKHRSEARDSIADYTKAIELDPNDAEAYFNRGDSKYLLEDYSEAIADYTKAIEIDPNNVEAEVYFNRGDSKYQLNESKYFNKNFHEPEDYSEATADFTKAIEINPNYAEAYGKRGQSRFRSREYSEAIADYTKAIEIDPNDFESLYVFRGYAKHSLKNYKGALADSNKAIELDPNDAYAYCLRGESKDDLEDFKGAIVDYTKAIEIDPDHFNAHVQRAYTRNNLKDYTGAIADYDKVLEIEPEYKEAYIDRAAAKVSLELDNNDTGFEKAMGAEQSDAVETDTNDAEAKEGKNTRVDAQKVPALRAFFSKKNILLILIVLGVLVAILIKIGYSQGRVLMDDLTDKGTKQSPTMYYEGALFNGVGFNVYSNGQLKKETNYEDGKEDGLQKGWHKNGQLKFEANYKDGEKGGLQKGWHKNGQLQYEDNYKGGKRDGLQKWWYKNGQLHLERHYRYGEEDGLAKTWHKNGQLYKVFRYRNGKRDGLQKTWYDSGQLHLERHYRDGEEDGLWKSWYKSGQLETILNYKDGEYDGLWQRWYENGKLQFTVKY
jgi:antitoxin component YwqK of YwqJK toxin-antitoxin module/Flp pilus assembly protein TadD